MLNLNSRKILVPLIMFFGLAWGSQAQAQVSATAQTTIDVNFPEILVLFTFSQITLDLDATFFTDQLGLGEGDAGTSSITVDAGSEDIDIGASTDVPADADINDVEIDLLNAIGARSIGLTDTNYTVDVSDTGSSSIIDLSTTNTIGTLSNSGVALSTTNLPIVIDVSEITGPLVTDSETFDITVSGT